MYIFVYMEIFFTWFKHCFILCILYSFYIHIAILWLLLRTMLSPTKQGWNIVWCKGLSIGSRSSYLVQIPVLIFSHCVMLEKLHDLCQFSSEWNGKEYNVSKTAVGHSVGWIYRHSGKSYKRYLLVLFYYNHFLLIWEYS